MYKDLICHVIDIEEMSNIESHEVAITKISW